MEPVKTKLVYCAKYWDTIGIETVEVAVGTEEAQRAAVLHMYRPTDRFASGLHFSDTYVTLEEARLYVERRKLAKLKSLERKMRKIEAIDPSKMEPKPRVSAKRWNE